ncbi:MAG: addiction module protein [Verrucomicrobiota bacterium]
MELPENERAVLAAHLLNSLPACLSEEDEGVAEALRRERELNQNPAAALSLAELKSVLKPSR